MNWQAAVLGYCLGTAVTLVICYALGQEHHQPPTHIRDANPRVPRSPRWAS